MPQSDLTYPDTSNHSPTTTNAQQQHHHSESKDYKGQATNAILADDSDNVVIKQNGKAHRLSPQPATTNGLASTSQDAIGTRKRKLSEIETPDKASRPKPISPPWKKVAADGPTALKIDGRRISARANPGLVISTDATPKTPTAIKKEKPTSPPWKSIAPDGPTARIVDGRRVSARTVQSPAEVQPSPKSATKRVSPPWKNIKAEGPSAKIVNGRRVSSRTARSSAAVDIASPRADINGRLLSPPWKKLSAEGSASVIVDGRRKSTRRSAVEEEAALRRRSGHAAKSSKLVGYKDKKAKSNKAYHTSGSHRAPQHQIAVAPKSPIDRRSTSSLLANRYGSKAADHSDRRTSGRALRGSKSVQEGPAPYAKIRLRVRGPAMLHQHPTHFARPRTHETLTDWLQHDNPLEGETALYTKEAVQREAEMRLAIIRASEDNGVLSDARCTRFALRPSPEPLKKYGHQDHIVNHAAYFAFLRKKEMQRHTQDAAKVARQVEHAVAIDPRWAFLREAKSAEQLWEEQIGHQKKRYVQLVKDLTSSWSLVRQEVDRIKFVQWEKEQDALGKKHLDEMLDHSKFVLNQQFRESSTDITSVNDSRRESVIFDESDNRSEGQSSMTSDEQDEDEDDENLSDSSEDEKDEADELIDDDTGLTQDELRQKYASALKQEHVFDDMTDTSVEEESEAEYDEQDDRGDLKAMLESQRPRSRTTSTSVPSSLADQEREQYAGVEIEDVDSDLLDDSDLSTDMSSNMGDSDSAEENNSSSEDEAGLTGLAGFLFSRDELLKAKEDAKLEPPEPEDRGTIHRGAELIEDSGVDSHDIDSRLELAMAETSSERGSDVNLSAASTTWQENEAAISTRTTSVVPETPKRHRIEVSSLLRGTLREYQHEGVDWLAQLYSGGRNGILADEMGLGKTIQTIALLAHLATHHGVWGPHLVVVPTSVMLNWEMEFKKWCPSFKILTYYGDINERKRKRRGWNNDDMWNVCITSYNIILQDQQVFKRRGWHYLVLDEAHNIKNFQSQRWQTLLTFRTHSRLLLTGTPLQNNLQELWSLLYFLMPAGVDGEGFADLEKFLNTMKRPADQIMDQGRQELDPEAQSRVTKLHEILRPYLLRRLKADVEKQMPSKYEHVVYCRLSKRQRQLYDEFMGRADTKRTLASGNYMSIINCLMSLRKVCNHPDLFETRQIVTSFAMTRSAVASFEIKDLIVRRKLLRDKTPGFNYVGLMPVQHEVRQHRHVKQLVKLEASKQLRAIADGEERRLEALEQKRTQGAQAVLNTVMIEVQRNIVADLRRQAHHTAYAATQQPIYGVDLLNLVKLSSRWEPARPSRKRSEYTHGSWFLDKCTTLDALFPTVQQVSEQSKLLITKFSCITPAAVAEDVLDRTISPMGRAIIQEVQESSPTIDPYHEPRIRQSIAFPDKRLLQFDCGKLQALDKLLRDLQAGGHRCLIFTQMTRVLDILEQFLNIHGHRYLRLDGSTKVEQRQILTDRFNQDTRILAFILSSRSGGLGINLTGADTVIFYDLDWNPAMDKQCQDRCHRIGQTRDVHIYRFVSEYTIEANILRKSNQKRLLDDVIIQRGDFTTDMFERVTYRDALDDMIAVEDNRTGTDANASAALDKFLGNIAEMGNVLDNVEDKEDAAAAKAAQKEAVLGDGVDFDEHNTSAAQASALAANPSAALDAAVDEMQLSTADELPHVDEYMVRFMMEEMKWDPIRLATKTNPSKKRSKKAADWRRKR